MIASEVPI